MGIGGTAKKLQKVAEMGEELYTRINDLRAQVSEMRETVTATHDRVDTLENEVAEQRAILEALAAREGIDVDAVVAEAHITEAEGEGAADGPRTADDGAGASDDDGDHGTDGDRETDGTDGASGATPDEVSRD
jgi:peptidoglycan hydrolase CwlO-like protein